MNKYGFHKYQLNSLYALILSVLLTSCNSKDKNVATFKDDYSFEIIDTLKIKHLGRGIELIDVNKTNGDMLFTSAIRMDTIVQTDSNGNIKNKIKVSGEGGSEIGFIFNLSYIGDTAILINSNRGFFFYDLNGKALKGKAIIEKTSLKTLGSNTFNPSIASIKTDTGIVLALQLKNSLNDYQLSNIHSKESYQNYKSLTFYSLDKHKYINALGFEPESIFMDFDYHYGDINTLFVFNQFNKCFYTLHDPDSKLYKYDVSLKKIKVIDLEPENFKLPIKYNFSKNSTSSKHMDVNSSYVYFSTNRDISIVTYRTGIPEDEYNKTNSESEIPELWKKYMKYYALILIDDNKVCNDVPLPYGAVGVTNIIGGSNMILSTNPAITETPDATIFYRCKLKINKK
ncbi:hypothetical protein VB264_16400 [Arcicella aquatica]|uniref:DUF4221 domain-containing protein n=1 Tax=Arcicella aquatica TaxID=217141 RepID=A0ABU5QQN1_9BACT|nr:hypothetical protein [Arcicella aquatica]MEA5259381.1 hypothetical protein [Arcicella aquatica]